MNQNEESNESSDWLNEAFVEKILQRGKNDAELRVTHIDAKNAVSKGDNFVSVIKRVAIEYNCKVGDNRETKKCALIIKSLPKGEFFLKMVSDVGAFVRELYTYEVALPQIYKLFLEKTGFDHEHFATNFYTTDRPDTIILDDLRPLGYKMADRREGLDLEHSVLVIRTLAKLHASSLVLHAENPEAIEFYKESFYIEKNRKLMNRIFSDSIITLAGLAATWPGFERFEEKLHLVATTFVDRMLDLVKHEEGCLRVLNHGDFWLNNMMFRYENGKPVDLKMVDFQMVRFASPAFDLMFFLHTSLRQEVFENFWDQLIKEYHESLKDTLESLGDERVISLEDILRELRDKAYMGVVTSCVISLVFADPEDAPVFSVINEDEEEGPKEASEEMKRACQGKTFINIIQRRLTKFEEQGLI